MPAAKPDDHPLPLHQVLEEEYERINSAPPPSRLVANPSVRSDDRLSDIFNDIHAKGQAALCLSGGGIRSATFGLGVLQGLARRGVLDQFSYLSTVSGGGYVGGWLSAWSHRHLRGVTGVMDALKAQPDVKLAPEPMPVVHLRSYSNYLTPSLGFLSADTWTLAAIIVRNLILNWLVLIPLMLGVLALPRFAVALARVVPAAGARPWALLLALFVGFACGVVSIGYVGLKRPSATHDDNDWRGFTLWCLTPLVGSAFALSLYWAWLNNPAFMAGVRWPQTITDKLPLDGLGDFLRTRAHSRSWAAFAAFGLLLYLVGWLGYSYRHGRFSLKEGWRERLTGRMFVELLLTLLSGATGGLVLWLIAVKLFPDPQNHVFTYVSFAVPLFMAIFFLTATLFAGISSEYTSDDDREWWARFSGWVLIALMTWAAASFLVLLGPPLLSNKWEGVLLKIVPPAGGLVGLITTYVAKSARSPAHEKQERKQGGLRAYSLTLGALVFIALLVVLLSYGTNYLLAIITLVLSEFGFAAGGWLLTTSCIPGGELSRLDHSESIRLGTLPLLGLFFVLAVGLGVRFFSRYINTNKFSQHAMYRNRLIRAYLGASNQYRDANRFTGFDAGDNIPMHHLRPEMFHLGSFRDIGQFALKLKEGKEMIHSGFRLAMAPDTIKLIGEVTPARTIPKTLQHALVRDLNSERFLYKDDTLFDDFPGFTTAMLKDQGARDLHERYARGQLRPDEMMLLNRRLIEAAFPADILPCPPPPHRPFHVVNIALNLVRGTKLAWQDRKAESFTVSPMHCGSCQIPDYEDDDEEGGEASAPRRVYGAYRRSRDYGGKDTEGISLGTAVAVSGAAVSPNMGYYSSPLVTFLMTLFNVRLGWWLGNPGKAGDRGGVKYYQLANPKSSAYPIVAEALGLTDDENNYVYLSDGGHFENLGLYEMILRRNHLIVVSDASDDYDFKLDNLGNAIRKIRVDFGIPVEFDSMFIYPRSKGQGGAFCAIGRIEYSRVDMIDGADEEGRPLKDETGRPVRVPAADGTLIYVKPVFYGSDEPRDIYHYAQANERFPHESTADQWFSEEQFESYRSLGMYVVGRIIGDWDTDSADVATISLAEFQRRAEAHVADHQRRAKSGEARPSVEDVNALLAAAVASLRPAAPKTPAPPPEDS